MNILTNGGKSGRASSHGREGEMEPDYRQSLAVLKWGCERCLSILSVWPTVAMHCSGHIGAPKRKAHSNELISIQVYAL